MLKIYNTSIILSNMKRGGSKFGQTGQNCALKCHQMDNKRLHSGILSEIFLILLLILTALTMEQCYAAFFSTKNRLNQFFLFMHRNWNRHDSGSFWNFSTLAQWSSIKLMQLWQLRTFHRLPKGQVKKVLRVFLLAIHSHLYSFALRFLFIQTHATCYSFYSSITVHCKGERRKSW